VETSWRPASAEEGFEIVRRRLFQPITDPELFTSRDAVVKAFADEYRKYPQEFPSDAGKSDFERRMRTASPIHPEMFDRLYNEALRAELEVALQIVGECNPQRLRFYFDLSAATYPEPLQFVLHPRVREFRAHARWHWKVRE
jgi:hypothetical protein